MRLIEQIGNVLDKANHLGLTLVNFLSRNDIALCEIFANYFGKEAEEACDWDKNRAPSFVKIYRN